MSNELGANTPPAAAAPSAPAPERGTPHYGDTFDLKDPKAFSTPVSETPSSPAPAAQAAVTPTAPAPVTSPEPVTPPASVQTPAATPPGSEPEKTETQKRMDQLTAKRREEERLRIKAEQEAAYYKGLAEGRTPASPQPVTTETRPSPDDIGTKYSTYEDYLSATIRFDMRQELAEQDRQRESQRAQETEAQTTQRVHTDFMSRINQVRYEKPVVDQALNDPAFLPNTNPLSHHIAQAIKESEISPALIEHLYSNKAELDRLYTMSPYAAAKEIGKLEARLAVSVTPTPVVPSIPVAVIPATPAPAQPQPSAPISHISQAPEPITALKPSGDIAVDIADPNLPMTEFVKRRNSAQFGGRRR